MCKDSPNFVMFFLKLPCCIYPRMIVYILYTYCYRSMTFWGHSNLWSKSFSWSPETLLSQFSHEKYEYQFIRHMPGKFLQTPLFTQLEFGQSENAMIKNPLTTIPFPSKITKRMYCTRFLASCVAIFREITALYRPSIW